MYACGFRIYFTPLPGFFSPFPHGTCSLSVDYEYLALEDGPPIFRQDYTCPALLVVHLVPQKSFPVRGYHPLWPDFPDRSAYLVLTTGLFRVRSSLLAESLLMSFPPGTEIFQFPGFASPHYGFMWRYPCGWVAPFGDPGINDCSHLPRAFRSVPRPSSPLSAKASTKCPSFRA